ncbi:AraC family transcriptional regulator [Sporolactobacillus shoreicorticis]|uniref:Helix-turn-helix domain-containing protein n=1 Tax=Sporolactobacillus shoreicorticis TaxID=1923877 RepID=A0ABW5S447_9BACL|nr:AraC family transcriptional regulator [Sporolactobacillus shoreicorticis]MCO7125882.1 AraC family transcriptional regulator [Sporolactobacillus shoreicorticis]
MKNETNYSPKRNADRHAYLDINLKEGLGYGWRYQENWHEEMQFYYVVSGLGRIRCESDVFDLRAGETLLINCNELHVIESLCDQLTFCSIRIDLAAMFQDMPDLIHLNYAEQLMQQRIVFDHIIDEKEQLVPLLHKLIAEHESHLPGCELALKSVVLQILVILIRNYIQKIYTKKRFDLRISSLNQLKSVIAFIHEQYTESITVHDLAERALMSESHFCRTFKKLYGKTVVAYVNTLRIEQAEKLLQNSPLTITEIAMNVGFNDANYFSRVFKQLKGTPPQTERNRIRQTMDH